MKAGVMCCSFVIPFFVFGLRVFSTVLPILPMKAGIEWCAALWWFLSLCLVLKYFQQSTISTYDRDWVMCCSFVIPFFVFGLKVFFNSPTQFLPMKGCDVLLFCDSFLVFGLRVFSTVTQYLLKAGIEWCAALFVIPFFVFWS
jgi:hypothetical protein